MAYLRSIQIPQENVLAQIDPKVEAANQRLDSADETVAGQAAEQAQLIEDIRTAQILAPTAAELAEEAATVLEGAGDGLDTDGDGVSDRAERVLSDISERAAEAGVIDSAVTLDATSEETVLGTSDAQSAAEIVSALEAEATALSVTVENQEALLEQAEFGLRFVETGAEARKWAVDHQALADATFGGDLAQARRAVGLFNGYCARCHTAGYSAGPAFQQEQASGALGPSLRDGRANVQFLDEEALVEFLIRGTENGIGYGVNGVGSGRMPAFGAVLSAEDIEMIARYLRGPTLDGVQSAEEMGDA